MDYKKPQDFIDYYKKVRSRTLKIVELITPGSLNYRPRADKFSLGDLARHIALLERDFYQPCLLNQTPNYKGCDQSFGDSIEAIISLYAKTAKSMEVIMDRFQESDLTNSCQLPGGTISRWKLLRLITEHEIHHRGQIYLLLSHAGVDVPQVFGLSSEDLVKISNRK